MRTTSRASRDRGRSTTRRRSTPGSTLRPPHPSDPTTRNASQGPYPAQPRQRLAAPSQPPSASAHGRTYSYSAERTRRVSQHHHRMSSSSFSPASVSGLGQSPQSATPSSATSAQSPYFHPSSMMHQRSLPGEFSPRSPPLRHLHNLPEQRARTPLGHPILRPAPAVVRRRRSRSDPPALLALPSALHIQQPVRPRQLRLPAAPRPLHLLLLRQGLQPPLEPAHPRPQPHRREALQVRAARVREGVQRAQQHEEAPAWVSCRYRVQGIRGGYGGCEGAGCAEMTRPGGK